MNDWNASIIEEFRAHDGRVGGRFEGAPLLLLHTTGAKSGEARVNPVMYRDLGEGRVAVFASYAGLDVNPQLSAEIGTATRAFLARVASGDERAAIWEEQKAAYPGFAGYEAKTAREIPVVVLDPR